MNAVRYPEWVLEQDKHIRGKTYEISMPSVVYLILKNPYEWLLLDTCTIVIQDVHIRRDRVKNIGDLFVLSLQFPCESKITPNPKFILKKV